MIEHQEWILVLDFGSQYTQLIARRIRECGVYSEIKPYSFSIEEIKKHKPSGIILSGGPSSVYQNDAPIIDSELFKLEIPILGICYGLQIIAYLLNGKVDPAIRREYGRAKLEVLDSSDLFKDIANLSTAWMSHGDHLTVLPIDFSIIAKTENSPIAAIRNLEKNKFEPSTK